MTPPTRTRLLALACAGSLLAWAVVPAAATAQAAAVPAQAAVVPAQAAVVPAQAAAAPAVGPAVAAGRAALGVPAAQPVTIDDRGSIVTATLLARRSSKQVARYLARAGLPVPARPQGADLYAVVHRTLAVDGTPTTASGVVALPHRSRKHLWTVTYEHGTLATKADAPSMDEGDGRAVPLMFAAAGFAGVAPDYLGLGKGPGYHPYLDAATEASASADLLRAATELAGRQGRALSGDLLVTGFSQGGHAAMALARSLRDDDTWRVRAVAPVSGPYRLRTAEMPALLGGRLDPSIAAFYLAYWTVSTNRLHRLYDSPGEVFRRPAVERLFDGAHSFRQITAELPRTPRELATPAYLKRLAAPSGPLLEALEANDGTCAGWRPGVPVHLYGAHGDKEVAFANSRQCLGQLRAAGVKATLTDVGDVPHMATPHRALPEVFRWFTRIRGA
ncbi:hypothetical protein [Nonomuraea sp. NPDC050783]|uniref:hypothetical protein n=1 Tax=Nonomuraea sp. NPDC050783 TaxID=3154634 RepID=UPI003466D08C